MRLAVTALLAAQFAAAPAAAAAAGGCSLQIVDARRGMLLARVALPADQRFALVYRHSVTQRPVESRYQLRAGRTVQTAELFDAHGPGMATAAGPGERFERIDGPNGPRFVLHMARPLPALVVRLHEIPAFELQVGAKSIALDQWQARVVELKPHCDAASTALRR